MQMAMTAENGSSVKNAFDCYSSEQLKRNFHSYDSFICG